MGRAALVIDYKKLQEEINYVESKETFLNYATLCQAVSVYDSTLQPNGCTKNTKHVPKVLHPGQCYLALSKKLVTCKTTPGKKGRVAGQSVTKSSKAERFGKNPLIMKSLEAIKKDTPEAYQHLYEQERNGSMKAAVKLNCMRCTGFTGAHKICDVQTCDLLPFNLLFWPNRGKEDNFIYNPLNKALK